MKPKIVVETDSCGICKLTLETSNGEAGLRLLKNSLPALRLFDAMIPTAYGAENESTSGGRADGSSRLPD
jgi:hypothetical protein